MKKIIIVTFTLCLVVSILAGCSRKAPSASPSSPANPEAASRNISTPAQSSSASSLPDSQNNSVPAQLAPASPPGAKQNGLSPEASNIPGDSSNASSGVIQQGLTLIVTQPLDGATINGNVAMVRGNTVTGAAVTIDDQTAIADKDGNFSINANLEDGLNAIDVVATDIDGNQGEVLLLVTADLSQQGLSQVSGSNTPATVDPATSNLLLQVNTPSDGATLDTGNINIKGQTEPEATVCVNDQVDIADANGNFNIPITLAAGPEAIDISASDDNGKQNEVILMVNVIKGS